MLHGRPTRPPIDQTHSTGTRRARRGRRWRCNRLLSSVSALGGRSAGGEDYCGEIDCAATNGVQGSPCTVRREVVFGDRPEPAAEGAEPVAEVTMVRGAGNPAQG